MTAFDTASRDVLAEFLQTVVVIDDAAYGFKDAPVVAVKAPGRGPKEQQTIGDAPPKTQSAQSLDTQLLVESFAQKGLVCSVVAPRKNESIAERLGPTSERSDIVVIDWEIFDDNGSKTIGLITEFCNGKHGERLHMICVYSGVANLDTISERLCENIEGLVSHNDNIFLLRKNHVIVSIIGKQEVLEDKIADRLLEDFSLFTKGLLSNAALAALTGIRRNAHQIIRKFDNELDQAYLSHRIMSAPIETVENDLISIIASELESIVYQSKAAYCISTESIVQWIDSRPENQIDYSKLSCSKESGPSVLKMLVENGLVSKGKGDFNTACGTIQSPGFVRESKLTALLGNKKPEKSNHEFAILTTLATRYENHSPRMTLGTIIRTSGQYLLCLTPRCDSARVPMEGRNFIFVRLTEKGQNDKLIIKDGAEPIVLGIHKYSDDTTMYHFVPNEAYKPIFAQSSENYGWYFSTNISGINCKLRWVAELKPQIAQSYANDYAAQVCRVGVAKSKWLEKLK